MKVNQPCVSRRPAEKNAIRVSHINPSNGTVAIQTTSGDWGGFPMLRQVQYAHLIELGYLCETVITTKDRVESLLMK